MSEKMFEPKLGDSFNEVPETQKDRFKPAENGGFVYAEALSKEEAEEEAYEMQEKISNKNKPKISEIGKKVIEEAKNYSNEEIANWSKGEEEETWCTEFIDRALLSLKKILPAEEFKQFNESLTKHPLIDLACGSPHLPEGNILELLFKEEIREGDIPKKVKDAGLSNPPKYIGVDKYSSFDVDIPESMTNKIKFEEKDLVEFLRTLPDNSVNIFIGGFDYFICGPENNGNKYRTILISEIARVLAKEGYCLAVESPLVGRWNAKLVQPEDFGLEKVPIIGKHFETINLFKKPE